MKVLVATSAYPAFAGDARGIHIHRLVRSIGDLGVKVTVVAPGADGAPEVDESNGVKIRRATYAKLGKQKLAVGLGGIVPNLQAHPLLVRQVPALFRSMKQTISDGLKEHDLVHAHWLYPAGTAAAFASRNLSIPLIVTSHGGDLNFARRRLVLRRLARQVAFRADYCVAVSEALMDDFRGFGVPESRIKFLPLGVGLEAARTRPREGQDEFDAFAKYEGLKVVYVGSLTKRKSVETLIHALSVLRARGIGVVAAIVGAGPTDTGLRSQVAELRLVGISFLGEQDPDDVGSWVKAADVLVLPSLSEGRPVVVMEAMALGTAVVATDISGTRELISDLKTGLLFPPGEWVSLADRLSTLATDPVIGETLASQARQSIVERGLTIGQVAQAHVELYERVLASRKASS